MAEIGNPMNEGKEEHKQEDEETGNGSTCEPNCTDEDTMPGVDAGADEEIVRESIVFDHSTKPKVMTAEELEAERLKTIQEYFSFWGGFCHGLGIQSHKRCLALTLLFWFLFFVSCATANGAAIAFLVLTYIASMVEFCYAGSTTFVKEEIIATSEYPGYLDEVCNTAPVLNHTMKCVETKTWQETYQVQHTTPGYTDSNGYYHSGSTYYTTETRTQSSSSTCCDVCNQVNYDSWYDSTDRVPLRGFFIKLYSEKAWFGDDDYTCSVIDDQKASLVKQHNHSSYRSGGVDYTYSSTYAMTFDVHTLKTRQLVSDNMEHLPCWISQKQTVFTLMSMGMVGWFYRVWLSGISEKNTVLFRKVVKYNK